MKVEETHKGAENVILIFHLLLLSRISDTKIYKSANITCLLQDNHIHTDEVWLNEEVCEDEGLFRECDYCQSTI